MRWRVAVPAPISGGLIICHAHIDPLQMELAQHVEETWQIALDEARSLLDGRAGVATIARKIVSCIHDTGDSDGKAFVG